MNAGVWGLASIGEWEANTAHFGAFAAAAVLFLLGAALLLPRPQPPGAPLSGFWARCFDRLARARQTLAHVGGIILLFLCVARQQVVIDGSRGYTTAVDSRFEATIQKLAAEHGAQAALSAQYVYMPAGDSFRVLSLNNPSLAADYIWITSMRYIANSFRRGQKFELLLSMYDSLLKLDPHWVQGEILAGKVLSALEPNRLKVEHFYVAAMQENPENWRLPYEAGRLFVVPPEDLTRQKEFAKRAADWFEFTMRFKGLSASGQSVLRDWAARMRQEAGYYLAADEMLYENATNRGNARVVREIAAREWLTPHSMVLAHNLQTLANAYQTRTGRYPADFEALLALLPPAQAARYKRDAYGLPFEYDPHSGAVASRGVKARRALQVVAVVEGHIEDYRKAHQGAPPPSLNDLQAFLKGYFNQTDNPPNHVTLDALGVDFDTVHGPLGDWDYDPATGKIKLPPYCDPDMLFANAKKLLEDL